MKTTEQWLNELIPEVATLALDNVKKLRTEGALYYPEAYLHEALAGAFIWKSTKEGRDFWKTIHLSAISFDDGLLDSEAFAKEQRSIVEKYLKDGIDTN